MLSLIANALLILLLGLSLHRDIVLWACDFTTGWVCVGVYESYVGPCLGHVGYAAPGDEWL